MADLERRIQQIKNMKFPKLVHGPQTGKDSQWAMEGPFSRMGITVATNHVTVNIQGGSGGWQGKGSTVETAIAAALKKIQDHARKLGI